MAHDDWSAQRSPFFSIDTVRELLVPQYKKFVQHCHDIGVFFTLHSCGNGKILAPAMIEIGVDFWQLQENAMDIEEIVELYGDTLGLEVYFELSHDDDEAKEYISKMIQIMAKAKKPIISFFDMKEERSFDLRRYVYEKQRKVVLGEKNIKIPGLMRNHKNYFSRIFETR